MHGADNKVLTVIANISKSTECKEVSVEGM